MRKGTTDTTAYEAYREMKNKEWMPVNPCEGCTFDPASHNAKGICSSTTLTNSCYAYEKYKSAISALITYTAWLIEHQYWGHPRDMSMLESILKELKELK